MTASEPTSGLKSVRSHRSPQTAVDSILARSKAWLLGIADSPAPDAVDVGSLFRVLLGLHICECAITGQPRSSTLDEVARRLQSRLCVAGETFDPFQHDAKLLLLCHTIMLEQGVKIAAIASFAEQVAAALRQLPAIPPRYTGEAVLLLQLGYDVAPGPIAFDTGAVSTNACDLIRAEPETLRATCDSIANATQFGRRPLQADAAVRRTLTEILPVILLQSLRAYRLEMGATLLRTLRYLRLTRVRSARLATAFLIGQQQAGKFGYFGIEADVISGMRGPGTFSPTTQLYLPLTVSCLWALAEVLVPDFNLFTRRSRRHENLPATTV